MDCRSDDAYDRAIRTATAALVLADYLVVWASGYLVAYRIRSVRQRHLID